ncbi:hypothetical protein Lser_V15G30386 [Lactuca serriola]
MGTQMVDSNILAFIENEVMPLHEVLNAIRMVKNKAVEKINPLIITHASSLSSLQMESSSVDFIISMGTSEDFPGDNLVGEFSRVLKPGGEIFIHQSFDAAKKNTTSSLGRKLLVAGFSNIEVVQMAEVLSEGLQSFGVKGKKPSWKVLPKVVVVDEMDVIDEDSLLSEEDMKKSQLPTIGDCEVGSKRKTSQPPHSLQFEPIRFPTKTSQNKFHASQPQSTDDDDTCLPEPSRPVKSSKRKSSEKTANPCCTGLSNGQECTSAEEAALASAWVDILEEDGSTGNVETVELNDTDDEIEPEDDDIEPEEPRSPIGKDKGNRASSSTLSGSGMDEKIDRLVDKLDKFTSTYGRLEKEKIRIKEKAWKEKIRAQNEAREAEDFKILTTNIDHLTGPSLRAALALKEKIAKKYGFE